jgi:hypothetical protein
MTLNVALTESQLEALRERAKSLGVTPEQLASAVVADLTGRPPEDFANAATRVLSRNAELYQRLAK